jgi:hypothetical protein
MMYEATPGQKAYEEWVGEGFRVYPDVFGDQPTWGTLSAECQANWEVFSASE